MFAATQVEERKSLEQTSLLTNELHHNGRYNLIALIKAAALLNRRKSWRVLNNADLLHSLTLALLQNLLFTAYVASYLKRQHPNHHGTS